jgi:hypothetical protein
VRAKKRGQRDELDVHPCAYLAHYLPPDDVLAHVRYKLTHTGIESTWGCAGLLGIMYSSIDRMLAESSDETRVRQPRIVKDNSIDDKGKKRNREGYRI